LLFRSLDKINHSQNSKEASDSPINTPSIADEELQFFQENRRSIDGLNLALQTFENEMRHDWSDVTRAMRSLDSGLKLIPSQCMQFFIWSFHVHVLINSYLSNIFVTAANRRVEEV